MIHVRLYGVVRLTAGVSGFDVDVDTLDALWNAIPGVSRKEAKDLVLLVNGKKVSRWYRFKDGDEVSLMSPAGGG